MLGEMPSSFVRLREIVATAEMVKPQLVVVTDIEGPSVLGDIVAEAMAEKIWPGYPQYTRRLYAEMDHWYNAAVLARRDQLGIVPQWGTSTILTLAPLLAVGVTSDYLKSLAEYQQLQRRTPGWEEFVGYLKREQAFTVGITTGLEEPYAHIAKGLGLHGVVGTPFPIDSTRSILLSEGNVHELALVDDFLKDSYEYIDRWHKTEKIDDKDAILYALQERIGEFYEEQLGVSFDPKEIKRRGKCKTQIGAAIENTHVVGDRSKGMLARTLFNLHKDAFTVTIGDGNTDFRMLEQGNISIAVNGAIPAVLHAKIGVVTSTMAVMETIIELARNNPAQSIDSVVTTAQEFLKEKAFIHVAGPRTPHQYLRFHLNQKTMMRGEEGILFDEKA